MLIPTEHGMWMRCSKCGLIIYVHDSGTHSKLCGQDSEIETTINVNHGYFSNGLFHPLLVSISGNKNLASSIKNCAALLNPDTMRILRFKKGGYVMLGNEKNHVALQCWPCLNVSPSSIYVLGFSLLHHNIDGDIMVLPFPGPIFQAKKLIFGIKKHTAFSKSEMFLKHLKREINKLPIRIGMKLNVNCFGYPYDLTVIKIDHHFSNSNNGDMDVCSRLLDFNLAEDSKSSLSENKNCAPLQCKSVESLSKHNIRKSRLTLCDQSSIAESSVYLHHNNEVYPPKQFSQISSSTLLEVEHINDSKSTHGDVTFSNISGLQSEIDIIKDIINSVMNPKKIFMCNATSHSLLLTGSPGTGKTMVVKAICNKFPLPYYPVKSCDVFDNIFGSSVEKLKKIFQKAIESSPSVIFIDDLHIFSDSKCNLSSIISDTMSSSGNVLIIAATNSPNSVHSSLRTVFEKEIVFHVPVHSERKQILNLVLSKHKFTLSEEHVNELAKCTHGFTGADIERLCSEAEFQLLMQKETGNESISLFPCLKKALRVVKPGALSEFQFDVPNVKWNDIGGMHYIKQAIEEMVEWPLKYANEFKKFNITPTKGILMYGPPGCSKTMVAKALASEGQINFISVKGSQLFQKYVGESEKAVSELFKKARSAAPCVLFFDEIDSLVPVRGCTSGTTNVSDRVLIQLLVEIDGIEVDEGVHILAATNRPDLIDPSLLRPGRFDHVFYVPLPDVTNRKEIFEVKLKKMPLSSDVDVGFLVDVTNGYSGAEIVSVCDEAARLALMEDVSSENSLISTKHFTISLTSVKPRTSKESILLYEEFSSKHIYIM